MPVPGQEFSCTPERSGLRHYLFGPADICPGRGHRALHFFQPGFGRQKTGFIRFQFLRRDNVFLKQNLGPFKCSLCLLQTGTGFIHPLLGLGQAVFSQRSFFRGLVDPGGYLPIVQRYQG